MLTTWNWIFKILGFVLWSCKDIHCCEVNCSVYSRKEDCILTSSFFGSSFHLVLWHKIKFLLRTSWIDSGYVLRSNHYCSHLIGFSFRKPTKSLVSIINYRRWKNHSQLNSLSYGIVTQNHAVLYEKTLSRSIFFFCNGKRGNFLALVLIVVRYSN